MYLKVLAVISLMSMSFFGGMMVQNQQVQIPTQIFKQSDFNLTTEDWGKVWIYTSDSTSTYGTENTLTAMAVINPDDEIHPPHRHAEEEFLLVVEGNGTWNLNGELSNAEPGDLLYAKPWELHGIYNSGETPLKFFVVKWNNKGVETPTEINSSK
jgi:mannose-6-phosphate isomerase-like protein (cupin superfamily)